MPDRAVDARRVQSFAQRVVSAADHRHLSEGALGPHLLADFTRGLLQALPRLSNLLFDLLSRGGIVRGVHRRERGAEPEGRRKNDEAHQMTPL